MRNSTPYFLLIITNTFLLGFTLIRKKDSKLFSLFLSMAGLAFLFEYIVLVLFKSYRYYPKILKNSYFDNIFGANVSQLYTVPTVAVFWTAYQLKFKWGILFTLIFVTIEKIFLKLGIYKHGWWRLWLTGGSIPIFFLITKMWFRLMQQSHSKFFHIAMLYLNIVTIFLTQRFYLTAFFHTHYFKTGMLKGAGKDHIVYVTPYNLIISGLMTSLIWSKNFFIQAIGILFMYVIESQLYKRGILQISKNWSLLKFMIVNIATLVLGSAMLKTISNK